MAKGTRYTPEFEAKAVRLLTESRGSYSSETKAIEQVAKDLGVLLQFFLSNFCTVFPQHGLLVSSRNCTI